MTAEARRPYGELDRAQVVESLHNLARRVGVQGVTMRDLAADLGAVVLTVPGIAGIVQTASGGASAARLDGLRRSLLAEAGLTKPVAAAAHSVLYTYLLGSISLQESRQLTEDQRGNNPGAKHFRAGLDVIIAGIKASLREGSAEQ